MKKQLNKIYNKDKESYYKLVSNWLEKKEKKFIITLNPESLMLSDCDEDLKQALNLKEVSIIPDGIAIVKACKWNNIDIKERITGVDLADYLLTLANEKTYSMYLFGAKEEVINSLEEKIKKEYPNINLLGATNGYVKDKDEVMEKIAKLKPDICLVALGIPQQEKLIYKHLKNFSKGIFVGVGGSLDVLSGEKKRAPKIFIKLNLEWLYRIIKEPVRIKRFWHNNIKFIIKIKKEIRSKDGKN